MGRSFSMSQAWERNARHHERRERLMDLANQLARQHGAESPELDAPVRYGDDLEKGVRRVFTGGDLEKETNWVGYREGSELGLDREINHGGRPVLVIGKEVDYEAGRHRMRYVAEEADGSQGGEYEATWEQTGEHQWTHTGTKRIRGG